MPDNENATPQIQEIRVRPDGRRLGWTGQQWVPLPPISPQAAQQFHAFQQAEQQGITPNQQAVQQQAQRWPPISEPPPAPGAQQAVPLPKTPAAVLSRFVEVETQAPTIAGTAVSGPEQQTYWPALKHGLQLWEQDPVGMAKFAAGQIARGNVSVPAPRPWLAPLVAYQAIRNPRGFVEGMFAVPQVQVDWANQNWYGLAGDAAAAALNAYSLKGVVKPITNGAAGLVSSGRIDDVNNYVGYKGRELITDAMDNLKNSNPSAHAQLEKGPMGDIVKAGSGDDANNILLGKNRGDIRAGLKVLQQQGGLDRGDINTVMKIAGAADRATQKGGIISKPGQYVAAFLMSMALGDVMGTTAYRWMGTLGLRLIAFPMLERMLFLARYSDHPFAIEGQNILRRLMGRAGGLQPGAALGQLPVPRQGVPPGGGGGGGGAAAPAMPPGGPPPGGGGGAAGAPATGVQGGGFPGGWVQGGQTPGWGLGGGGGGVPATEIAPSIPAEGGGGAAPIPSPARRPAGFPSLTPEQEARASSIEQQFPGGYWNRTPTGQYIYIRPEESAVPSVNATPDPITMPPTPEEKMSMDGLLDALSKHTDPATQEEMVRTFANEATEAGTGLSEDDLKAISKAAGSVFQPAQQEMLDILDGLAQESQAGAKTEAGLQDNLNKAKAKMEAAATKARAAKAKAAPRPAVGPTPMPEDVKEAGADPAIGAGTPLYIDEVVPRLARIFKGVIEDDRAQNMNGQFFRKFQEMIRMQFGKDKRLTPQQVDGIISEAERQAGIPSGLPWNRALTPEDVAPRRVSPVGRLRPPRPAGSPASYEAVRPPWQRFPRTVAGPYGPYGFRF